MEKEEIENYLKKLVDIEKNLNDVDEDNINVDIFSDIDKIVKLIGNGVKSELPIEDEFLMDINYTKLSPDAVTPSYAKDGDAGLDFVATKIISETINNITYGTDISVEIPRGYVGLLFPRSSIRNYGLILSNCVGVIDSGSRGEVMSTFVKLNGEESEKYNVSNKIFQMIIIAYPKIRLVEKDKLSETDRGTGGYGSTGVS